ncbi:MAG: hypothetical protein AAFO83_10280 [Cyanobacteria bacterium J06607_13]
MTLLSSRLYSRSQQQAQVSGIASGLPRQNGLAKTATAAMFGVASLSATLLAAPASANVDYFECTTGMVDAGVSEEAAIAACASARYPDNLGACVVDVSEFTGLTANSALLICQRSRRPNEVADCTINIHEAFLDSPSTKVLENCGRTLLPERYGTCVVDIVEATDVSVDTGLDQCIQAGYRPWRIQPRLE